MSLLSLPRTERRTRSSCQSFPRAFILRTSFFWVSELMLKIRPAKSPLFIWVGVACHAQQVCVQRKAALTAEVRHYLYSPVFCVYTAALIKQPKTHLCTFAHAPSVTVLQSPRLLISSLIFRALIQNTPVLNSSNDHASVKTLL